MRLQLQVHRVGLIDVFLLGGVFLLFQKPACASPQKSGVDLLSCMSSTDQRLEECGIRGFDIADRDRLQTSLERTPEFHRAVPRGPRVSFWTAVKRFPQLVSRGFRHFFVPKARAFLCMDPEDGQPNAMHRAVKPKDFYEVDHLWAFERANPDAFDAEARAWQRGHDQVNANVSLEPDLKTDHYGMSLDIRF